MKGDCPAVKNSREFMQTSEWSCLIKPQESVYSSLSNGLRDRGQAAIGGRSRAIPGTSGFAAGIISRKRALHHPSGIVGNLKNALFRFNSLISDIFPLSGV
jgi:hypothetical protein